MKVGVIGINHKLADLRLRESFAKVCQKRFSQSIFHDHSLVLLSTCNRAEVYFSSNELSDTHSYLLNIFRDELIDISEAFDQKLYSYFGRACFEHLAVVTAGLDSAIIAETEIQGQVKGAYELCAGQTSLPQDMHFLFQKSLKIAKDVRTALSMGRGMPDLEHAVLNTGLHFFGDPSCMKILFVGASEINEKIIAFFKSRNIHNITVCNRSNTSLNPFVEKYQVNSLEWYKLSEWYTYDWIIFGTKSSEHLITRNDLPMHVKGNKLVIDLCVPRNVEPRLGRDPRITLLNIDQIDRMLSIRKQRMSHAVAKARELVILATKRNIELFKDREQKRCQFLKCA